jgi:hypothetical protein
MTTVTENAKHGGNGADIEARINTGSTAAPDPFNPEAYLLTQDFSEFGARKEVLSRVDCDRFDRDTWFRVHPDPAFRANVCLLSYTDEGETRGKQYLVSPELYTELAERIRPYTLFTAISRQKVIRLYPVQLPIPNGGGRGDAWRSSRQEGIERAMTTWVQLVADMQLGAYRIYIAPGKLSEPQWPDDLSFKNLMMIAFRDRLIDDREHPIVRKIQGYE